MSDLYNKSTAFAQAQFRENTEKRAVMLNAQVTPTRCKCVACGKPRTASTGKMTKAGFVCGMCHSPRRVS